MALPMTRAWVSIRAVTAVSSTVSPRNGTAAVCGRREEAVPPPVPAADRHGRLGGLRGSGNPRRAGGIEVADGPHGRDGGRARAAGPDRARVRGPTRQPRT